MSQERMDASDLAARQYGLITADQAAGAGLSIGQVRSLIDSGMWRRRWREVYAVAGAPPSFEADVMAACLAGGPHAMACRGTVARLLGVGRPYFDHAAIEIALPRGASVRAASALGASVHVYRHLDDQDRASIGPIPATGAMRLVVDLLDATPVEAVFAVADDVLQHRWATAEGIRRRWSETRVHHRDVLEAVLLPWGPGARAGSPKEMALARVLELHGLPRPVRQHPVRIPGRAHPRYLDLAYPDARIAPEYDGRREHGVRQWDRDARREDELAGVGWIRLPAGPSDLTEPGASAYCNAVRAALCARAAG